MRRVQEAFVVDVHWSTHDLLKEGIPEAGFRRFRVLATDGIAATLLCAQWVAAAGKMPTRTTVHI